MKNILKAVLISMMCLCLFACSDNSKQEDEPISGTPNPMVSYDSLDVINEKIGVKLVTPQDVKVENETYTVINDEIAEYGFILDGFNYMLRGSKTTEDISGIYIDSKPAFSEARLGFVYDQNYKAYRFFIEDNQYVISVKDDRNIFQKDFQAFCFNTENEVIRAESSAEAVALIGDYQDSYSQRATACLELVGRDQLEVVVSWPNSAEEYEEWDAVTKYSGTKLRYDSIAHQVITSDADGNSNVSTNVVEEDGYFVVKEGKLYWTGSSNEVTSNCVFEKID